MELVTVSEESLFREVDEELRQEQYKKLWDKFGTYFVALCVVIVAAVAGFKGYEYYKVKQSQAAAVVYFDGVKRATDGKFCTVPIRVRCSGSVARSISAAGVPGSMPWWMSCALNIGSDASPM